MKKKSATKTKKGGKYGPQTVVLNLVPPGPQPDPVTLSELHKQGVRWHNVTDRGRTLTFTKGWPFVEPPQEIQVAAGKKTKLFHIYQGAPKLFPFEYSVAPTLVLGTGPGPGDPSVIGDD